MTSLNQNWKNFLEKGDEFSFSIIYNKYVEELYAYGISLGFQKENCKDAIQDVFIKIFLDRNNISKIENKSGYIFRSYKNRLIDLEKKNNNKDNIDSVEDKFTIEVTILDNLIETEIANIVKEKIKKLLESITPNQREVVYLKYVVGLQHSEIAEILGIHEESARKLLYRAMEKLRNKISNDELYLIAIYFMLLRFII
ncbi:sigma-70 family RNA polymerase sigma factor [Fermentimonas caenicola]|jgi:RNA polymerase sigma factor (sigma-70 family)|uniref:Sigma-70 family RNA polymerase sigma factor n=1 Tax=Fermentimonas caenicola TaxID=1562970 RepID=A0A098BZW9_9BACT|nr:RNA polymerase sigma factor [Lascolabacillus sp.]MCK9501268.1 RNA polymerase sigma factor [Lascolabacillus sp.]MDD3658746.1 RNA polymerase sigma factor [Lascolabacillus sp.]MDI9626781.1 RNA polymerase sigma factor [Bacteroidota bacterium]CEA16180.1 sigma-70 family RNA polymerase sigma factor [Fermentimonas caenicola]